MEEIQDDLIRLLNEFNELYTRLRKTLPFHLNVIDELHINENAHSRILCKLLQYQSENGNFDFLESLLVYIAKNKDKSQFSGIKIESPQITQETERIDLWIKDKGYAIIFENKVYDANDQEAQIARYIEKTKKWGYNEDNIFVIYMPSSEGIEPSEQTWVSKNKNYKAEFEDRYVNLSFRNNILYWLKESVLPNIRHRDIYLLSAISQYIDYLEGLFDKRAINKIMNMKLIDFLEKELRLNKEMSETEKLDILSKKRNEVKRLLNLINNQEEEIKNRIRERELEPWREFTKNDFDEIAEGVSSNLDLKFDVDYNIKTSELWISFCKESWNLSIILTKNKYHTTYIYIGKKHEKKVNGYNVVDEKKIFKEKDQEDNHPYGYEYLEDYNNKPDEFSTKINNGTFKKDLQKKIRTILENIKTNNLSM